MMKGLKAAVSIYFALLLSDIAFAQSAKVIHLKQPVAGFYTKVLDCDGLIIRSPDPVNDMALQVAAQKLRMMLAHIPAAKHNLVQWGAEIHIIGQHQATTDLPEFADMKGVTYTDNLGNKTNMDDRTRGMGGIYTSCGEENLLDLPGDRYAGGQDICIHEFAHNIMFFGLDDALQKAIGKQYQNAKAKGLWTGAYAMVDAGEYWAELSMWYFGKHAEFLHGTRNPAPGPEALKAYDADGYALLDAIYSGRMPFEMVKVTAPKKASATQASSFGDGKSARMMFSNNTGKKLKIFWVDQIGQLKNYGDASAYMSRIRQTHVGHVWELQDEGGKVVGRYVADTPYTRLVIN
ncbi:MAG: hypothetical protein V4592_25800 [Bacteroidota bacterium]